MYRLEKNGIVRETDSQDSAKRFERLGYRAAPVPGPAEKKPLGKTNRELYELCVAHGLEVPKGTNKDGLLALLTEAGINA